MTSVHRSNFKIHNELAHDLAFHAATQLPCRSRGGADRPEGLELELYLRAYPNQRRERRYIDVLMARPHRTSRPPVD